MAYIIKRLTPLVWYAAPLDLSTNFSWKSRINTLRTVNTAGAGYFSFDPARPANSLKILETGMAFTLDAKGIVAGNVSTFFDVPNGLPPSKQLAPDVYDLVVEADDPLVMDSWASLVYFNRLVGNVTTIGITPPGDPALDFTLSVSVNGGAYIDLPNTSYSFGAVNQAIQALDDDTVAAGYTLAFRCTRNLPVGVYFTVSCQL